VREAGGRAGGWRERERSGVWLGFGEGREGKRDVERETRELERQVEFKG
jgi:hypothetical protein